MERHSLDLLVYHLRPFQVRTLLTLPHSAEIFPMGIRSICLVFTTCAQWLGQFTIVYSTPYMMTDITYGTFLLFACSVVFGFVFTSLLIPETKGISLEDMDILFTRKGMPRTWRRQTEEIINQRRADGHADALGRDEKEIAASHHEA